MPLLPPVEPMLARLAREIPTGEWAYEPKWDGFRCVLFRIGVDVVLQSRNQRPLERYFPEIVEAARALPDGVVLDGELLVLGAGSFSFPALLERIHPSASRVRTLATQSPATYAAFDCLQTDRQELMRLPFRVRREALERVVGDAAHVMLTPVTDDITQARQWLDAPQPGWDGLVAKDPGAAYAPGRRVMVKVKHERTADCVVAGVRVASSGTVSSLLLGLWTRDGALHHPGVVSSPPGAVKRELAGELLSLVIPLAEHPWREGFGLEGGATGRLKGAGGRWLPTMTQDWQPIAPVRVAEVSYDRLDGLRFRHPAKFRHWRPDRDPGSCLVEQLLAGR